MKEKGMTCRHNKSLRIDESATSHVEELLGKAGGILVGIATATARNALIHTRFGFHRVTLCYSSEHTRPLTKHTLQTHCVSSGKRLDALLRLTQSIGGALIQSQNVHEVVAGVEGWRARVTHLGEVLTRIACGSKVHRAAVGHEKKTVKHGIDGGAGLVDGGDDGLLVTRQLQQ